MRDVAETIVVGLTVGSTYALMALGLVLIFGVLRSINFAHGEFYVLGGYAFYYAAGTLSISPLLALPMAAVVAGIFGWLLHRFLLGLRPTLSRFNNADYFLVVTFAVAILMESGSLIIFGANYRSAPPVIDTDLQIFGLTLGGARLTAIAGSVIAVLALTAFMRFTFTGRGWRAIAQNRLGAEVSGIDVRRESRSAFVGAVALAAFAGALLTPLFSVYPGAGVQPLATGFLVIVLGGMGSIPGALVGGLLVGLVDTAGVVYISSSYSGIYGFVLMIVVLLVKPVGLFGTKTRVI